MVKGKDRIWAAGVAGALLLGFVLRLYLLGEKNIWWDEGLSVWASRKGFAEIARWTGSDVHPPLYFWLLHLWRWLAGDSAWVLRFFSAWIGVLTIAFLAFVGRKLLGASAGLAAAIFLAVHPFAIWWSQEMRMYTLATFLLLVSTYIAIESVDGLERRNLVLYVLFTLAALHTLYISVFVVLAQDLVMLPWLALKKKAGILWRWVFGQFALALLTLPWLLYAYSHMRTWSVVSDFTAGKFWELFLTLMTLGVSTQIERFRLAVLAWCLLVFILLFSVSVKCFKESCRASVLLMLVVWLLVPPLAVYLLAVIPHPFYTPKPEARYLLASLPAFVLLVAWGSVSIRKKWAQASIALFIASSVFVSAREYYSSRWLSDDFLSISALLQAERLPGEAVLLHTDKDWPVFAAHYGGRFVGVPAGQKLSRNWVDMFLQPIWRQNEGIWLVRTPDSLRADPQGLIAAWLESHGRKVVSYQVGRRIVSLYRKERRQGEPEVPSAFLAPRLFLNRAHSGDATAALICGANGFKDFEIRLGQALWRRGQLETELRCGLVPLVVPSIPGKHKVTLIIDGKTAALGKISISVRRPTVRLSSIPGLVKTPYEWDGGIRLLGYELSEHVVRPGGTLTIVMVWEAGTPTSTPHKLFVHLLGKSYNAAQGNFLWGQRDAEPMGGLLQTTSWVHGQRWEEKLKIPVSPDAPDGQYKLEIGWYDEVTGARIKLKSPKEVAGANRVILTEITVKSVR